MTHDMADDLRSCVISALEERLARAHQNLDTWKRIEHEARTTDLSGNTHATGTEMVRHFEDEIKKIKDLIARHR